MDEGGEDEKKKICCRDGDGDGGRDYVGEEEQEEESNNRVEQKRNRERESEEDVVGVAVVGDGSTGSTVCTALWVLCFFFVCFFCRQEHKSQ